MTPPETSDQGNMVSQREGEWVLVPREPTEAMLTAAHDAWGHVLVKQAAGWPEWAFIYSEMLSAAPPAEPRADEGGVSGAERESSASPAHPMGQGQAGKQAPFIMAALIKRDVRPGVETQGARGGIEWGASADEVVGRLTRGYLPDGWRVEILEVNPISGAGLARLRDYALSTEASPLGAEPDADDGGEALCLGCPPYGYPTDKTRCLPCPRRVSIEPPPLGSEPPCDEGNLPPDTQITQPSHDDEGLIERLNGEAELIEAGMNFDDGDTIDALRQAANTISRLKGELERVEETPGDPGGFEGDIFFGDPRNSTRGTHRWQGGQWEPLPSDAVVLMELLASARTKTEAAESRSLHLEAEVKELRSGLEPFAWAFEAHGSDCITAGEWEAMRNSVDIGSFRKARSLLSPAQEGLSSARASRDARSSTRPEGQSVGGGEG